MTAIPVEYRCASCGCALASAPGRAYVCPHCDQPCTRIVEVFPARGKGRQMPCPLCVNVARRDDYRGGM